MPILQRLLTSHNSKLQKPHTIFLWLMHSYLNFLSSDKKRSESRSDLNKFANLHNNYIFSKFRFTKAVSSSPFSIPCDNFATSKACFIKEVFCSSSCVAKILLANSELVFTTKLYISGKLPNIP